MIFVKHLFSELDQQLVDLLKSLDINDWNRSTSAKLWSVKDVAAHLLDSNLRTLSVQRDGFFSQKAPEGGYKELVSWLNKLNGDWVAACKGLSPSVLILLLEKTGKQVSAFYQNLDLQAKAIFPVAWAGEEESLNWMHLAREYTEKWHHQQQIREAVNSSTLLDPRFFEPVMDTFLLGAPHHFKNISMPVNSTIRLNLTGNLSKSYFLNRNAENIYLERQSDFEVISEVKIPSEIAWKLFCKNIRPAEIHDQFILIGNEELGNHLLQLVAVMA